MLNIIKCQPLYLSLSNNSKGILKKVLPLSHDGNSKFNKLCAVGKHNWNHTLKCQTHQSPAFLEVYLKTFPINIHPQWNFQTKKRAFKERKIYCISHCYFTRLNLKKMGPLQFCLPALLEIHRNHKQKEFSKSCEGFLR